MSKKSDTFGRMTIIPVCDLVASAAENSSLASGISVTEQLHEEFYKIKPVLADITPLNLPTELTSRMFDHQREGVQWLYGLHLANKGGILGDGQFISLFDTHAMSI